MSIFTFVTQDELDDLPEDPQLAFMTFVRLAQGRLAETTKGLNPEERYEWEELEELRHSFMNVVVAAAKRFEIEPFVDMEVPTLTEFSQTDHRQFRADLDHYITQLMLDNSIRAKHDSIEVLPKSKDRLRAYVHSLRDCVEQANMTAAKREALLRKLDAFEQELEKKRLSLISIARMTLELLALPGGIWASAEVTNRLIHNVIQIAAEAKAAEDESRQLPPVTHPKALSPPRKQEQLSGFGPSSRPTPAFDSDLDDDVPF
jgi:hypothetical protein